jgi:hypothetical protein
VHDDEDTIAVTETLRNAALLSALQQQGLFDVSSPRHSTQGVFRPLFHTRFLLLIISQDSDDTVSVTETLPEAALLTALQRQGFLDASSRQSTGTCTQEKTNTQLCVANFVFGLQRPMTPWL